MVLPDFMPTLEQARVTILVGSFLTKDSELIAQVGVLWR